jgi:hypothetical protein
MENAWYLFLKIAFLTNLNDLALQTAGSVGVTPTPVDCSNGTANMEKLKSTIVVDIIWKLWTNPGKELKDRSKAEGLMSEHVTFVAKVLSGEAMIDEIDDFVEAWHASDTDLSLEAFLGLKDEDYHLWVMKPNALPMILACYSDDPGFSEAVNDNEFDYELQLAARSSSRVDLRALKDWLDTRT